MKIAILGAGNVGCTLAADLSLKGHDVVLIKTSNALHNDFFASLQQNQSVLHLQEKNTVIVSKIKSCSYDLDLVADAQIIIVTIQSNYHEDLILRLKPYLHDGHVLMFIPGYLATALVLKYCSDIELSIVEAQSSPIDCRLHVGGICRVSFRNVRNPLGVFPASKKVEVQKLCDQLDFNYCYLNNVIEAALHNPNLIVHTVGAIMSIPRIEKTNGNYCMYQEVFTPKVWNLLEGLDTEKMDVLEALGCQRLSYVDACKFRNSLEDAKDAKEVFFEYANSPDVVQGPHVPDSRYVTEDVSQGLVMLEALGKYLNVKTPITTALIEVANAALQRNFRKEGRTIEKLGLLQLKKILNDKN